MGDEPLPPAQALSGVRVLDLSRVLAGPWASQVLADLGAEVIKVERPGQGDDTRAWGPPFVVGPDGQPGDAAYFFAANRNKRSITVDFTTLEGAKLVRRLAAKADIVVENYKLGGLAKYGLDYPTLRSLNPKLVYCSITGFGQTGPYAPRAGYDYLIQAMGGLMSITGQADGSPGAEPMKVGVAVADLFTGMYAAVGILAALRHAERTGEGQQLDVALLDCQVAMLANQAMNYLLGGQPPGRLGNAHPNITPYQVFTTSDGHLVLAIGNDGQFRSFCAAANLSDLADDPRFRTNADRVAHRASLVAACAAALAVRTTADWIALFEPAGVPCGPINRINQVFADPQVHARGLVERVTRPDGTAVNLTTHPVKFGLTPALTRHAPPALGSDTEAVLGELGLSPEEIDQLRAAGAI